MYKTNKTRQSKKQTAPDYHRIFSDIIRFKHPEKKDLCAKLLNQPVLSVLDIIDLNNKIFGSGSKSTQTLSQKHRSYNKSAILQMLDYQRKNGLNNSQLANYYKLSRNTVTKWKKLFI